MEIRDRVVGLVRVRASKIRENPFNWRTHPEEQREVFRAIAGEVGVAVAGLVRRSDGGPPAGLQDGGRSRQA